MAVRTAIQRREDRNRSDRIFRANLNDRLDLVFRSISLRAGVHTELIQSRRVIRDVDAVVIPRPLSEFHRSERTKPDLEIRFYGAARRVKSNTQRQSLSGDPDRRRISHRNLLMINEHGLFKSACRLIVDLENLGGRFLTEYDIVVKNAQVAEMMLVIHDSIADLQREFS